MVDILALVLQHDEQAVLTAVEWALADGIATKTHVLNLLHRLIDGKITGEPDIITPQTSPPSPDDAAGRRQRNATITKPADHRNQTRRQTREF